jgi:sugar phosphate permease
MNSALHAAATKKAMTRLVPLLMAAYFMSFIDRTNIGLAKTQLEADVGIGAAAYGLGAGVFFISYALLEVPSNLLLHKLGARRWIARIAVTWGLLSAAMMFTNSPTTFYVLRFLLGAAEAGLFPGLMYIITVWFAQSQRATLVGMMLIASSTAFIVGNPVGGALMLLDGAFGLHGWQWMFLLEGIPTVAIGVLIWFTLPDRPSDAKWLTREEAAEMTARAEGHLEESAASHISLRAGFRNPLILTVAGIWFLNQIATYGVVFFTPAVVEGLGISGSFTIGIVAGLVGVGAIAGVLAFPRLLRRGGGEIRLIAVALLGTLLSITAFIAVDSAAGKMVLLGTMMFFVVGTQPLFWSLVMARVTGRAAAGLLAYVNTIGLIGAFVGPYAFGIAESITGSAASGIVVLIGTAGLSLAIVPLLSRLIRRSPVDLERTPDAVST